MKKNKISAFLVAFLLSVFLWTGCDNNMPEVKEVNVESIALKEELAEGLTIETGATANISWKVNLTPENATNRTESYYSSDPEVATVNARGQITANMAGTCIITISVGGKTADFTLTVLDKIIIPATDIQFTLLSLDLMLGTSYDLSLQVRTVPLNANDGVDYESSDPGVVSVSEDGVLTGVSSGTAIITVASKNDASIKDSLPVTVILFSGDYPRTNWTMTASHDLFIATNDPERNSLSSALDGELSTNFCMVRPGKNFGNNPNVAVPSGEAIYFVVDMKQPQPVDYFRIRHRDVTQAFIRWYSFDEILGSNDGQNFTVIATNVAVTDASVVSQQESPNIAIPKSTYRYLKFYAKSANCFYQSSFTSQGSSVQIQELYFGLNP